MSFFNRLRDKFSLATLMFLFAGIILLRLLTLLPNELSWDVLGYYLHLPAWFIYHDHGLNDIAWIQQLMDQYNFTGTLYQIGRGPTGDPIFFFLMGMSLFYLPWFLIAQLVAPLLSFPADGFSLPYQYILAFGTITYTVIALVYLRKILLTFFRDKLTAVLLIILVAGTNYLHFVTIKNLETANVLFLLVTLVVYNTIQWHQRFKLKNLVVISISIVLAALVKPSEVLVVFIPLFWGIYNKQTFYSKLQLLKSYRKQLMIGTGLAFLLAIPQMIYWYSETGSFIYDSYKNPAVGLDLFAPHILNVLFSFKKGWLLYTPVMWFSIAGLFVLYKRNRAVFVPVVIYAATAFYLLASWTEWWYGASYSIRPMISLYPVLLIAMGYFFVWVWEQRVWIKASVLAFVVFFMLLNLFQTWQFNNYVLDAFGTTKAYYFAVFGKTKISPGTRELLSMQRPFKGDAVFTDPENYTSRMLFENSFESADVSVGLMYSTSSENGKSLRVDGDIHYSPEFKIRYKEITDADHLWIRAKVDILLPEGYRDALPQLALMFDRREGSYHYRSYPVDTSRYKPGTWAAIQVDYLTPFIRSRRDYFKCHVYNQGNTPFLVDNFSVEIFEPMVD
jgi:hypothetical protein